MVVYWPLPELGLKAVFFVLWKKQENTMTITPDASPHRITGGLVFSMIMLCLAAFSTTGCRNLNRVQHNQCDMLAIAEGYLALNEPAMADHLYQDILKRQPNDGRAFLGLAQSALKQGRYSSVLRELNRAEQGFFLSDKERETIQILFGRTYRHMKKPPQIVWSYLYPVWRNGDHATRSALDRELKSLAVHLPSDTSGIHDVLGFRPKIPTPLPPPPKPSFSRPRRLPARPQSRSNYYILARSTWRPVARPNLRNLKAMSTPYRITVHHSDHDAVSASMSQRDAADIIRSIQRHHVRNNGWGDIGYHYMVDKQGRIWTARSMKFQGAHASGRHNRGNIGICLIGNFDLHRPTTQQVNALIWLVQKLRGKYNIRPSALHGHCHYKPTQCPGRYLLPLISKLRASPAGFAAK